MDYNNSKEKLDASQAMKDRNKPMVTNPVELHKTEQLAEMLNVIG